MPEEPTTYLFGPLERRAAFLDFRWGQIGIAAAGVGLALLVLAVSRSLLGGFLAIAVVGVAAMVAFFVPVAGRGVDEWLPIWVPYAWRHLAGQLFWFSRDSALGHDTLSATSPVDLPDWLGAVRMVRYVAQPGDRFQGELGVLWDQREATFTAVMSVGGRAISLNDTSEQERLLAAWSGVLSTLGREDGPVARAQILHRTVPDDADEAMDHYLRHRTMLPTESNAGRNYYSIVDASGPTSQQHELYVSLQISHRRARRAIQLAGGDWRAACKVLVLELIQLADRVRAAEIPMNGFLDAAGLATVIRTGLDPRTREVVSARQVAGDVAMVAETGAWPRAVRVSWDHIATEDALHATYWIAEWPRVGVQPDWMVPVVLNTRSRRTLGITMEPIAPRVARRRAQEDIYNDASNSAIKERVGNRVSYAKTQEHENVLRREAELAHGHADYRFSGYITVTAFAAEELNKSCGEIERQASASGLELRREFGRQDVSLSYTLPMCRGLR